MAGLLKTFVKTLPFVQKRLWQRKLQREFAIELSLINGTHHTKNSHRSIIHFSLNKAATQTTQNILKRCAVSNGMVPVGINDYAFQSNFPYLDHLSSVEMQTYQHIFKPNGYLYSVFGGMVDGIPNLDQYLVLLMIRDPRDVLVSAYYSVVYSHAAPDEHSGKHDPFLQLRHTAQAKTIDEFVIAESDRTYKNLDRYKALLLEKYPHTYVTGYEQMTSNFPAWLKDLLDHCQLEISSEVFQSIVGENTRAVPSVENIHQHIRKGKAGDYKEKLKPETIQYLNEKFAPLLAVFGYAFLPSP